MHLEAVGRAVTKPGGVLSVCKLNGQAATSEGVGPYFLPKSLRGQLSGAASVRIGKKRVKASAMGLFFR
jgi:hypothetical protein